MENGSVSKRRYGKFVLGFLGMLVGVFILYVIGFWAVRWYKQWQGEKRVHDLAVAMQKAADEERAREMADTYGGKTPQETLRMYIDAVEKGNYELASKYFVEEGREKELNSLKDSSKANIDKGMSFLWAGLENKGNYSEDKREYLIEKPLLVDFKLYPNGVWKIVEI